jgi:hypothetical protein
MPSLEHGTKPLVSDAEQARGTRHAASGVLKSEPDEVRLIR